ncbi:MAG: peptidyl-tRNA hydrolase [Candidatus Verstraetearchaeota archaeon]|nr:peptidyl-tRNA hydrolase [Candidatus Verstraetearchaeota archaeon]
MFPPFLIGGAHPLERSFSYKQVIVVRTDIKMSKGKLAVQVAHAAVSSFEEVKKLTPEWAKEWLREGQKKVVVKVKDLEELLQVKQEADRRKLPNFLVADCGLTELPPGTVTCLGIGPAPTELVDEVTGKLKLL